MISLNNITKQYGDKVVVNGIDLVIPTGKLSAFIGSNGAGKSTVLSMIGRILCKNEGTITIDEMDLEHWNSNALAKRISILKQTNHMNIRLTVQELVAFGRFP